MTPESCVRSLQSAARRGDWVQCEKLGRLYGWCMLVAQVRRGAHRASALVLKMLAPRRVR